MRPFRYLVDHSPYHLRTSSSVVAHGDSVEVFLVVVAAAAAAAAAAAVEVFAVSAAVRIVPSLATVDVYVVAPVLSRKSMLSFL